MKHWSESEWDEWCEERAAIIAENGEETPHLMDYVRALAAIERLRIRVEAQDPGTAARQMELL